MMEWAWLIPAMPAVAFFFLATAGRRLPNWAAIAATGTMAAAFIIFWFVFADWLAMKALPEVKAFGFSFDWIKAGGSTFTWGMVIDPISLVMVGLVTAAALGIQIYTWSYMSHEPRFTWFFAVHSLFAAAMLTLVLADNLLLLYIAWELVGICSYLLIGFFYDRRPAAEAAKKAFITTRIGDVGLLIGILLLFAKTGTFELSAIFALVENGGLSDTVITAAAVLLFLGAIGKSAQFPLHVWLPDAMEGPTPVSALVHSATMVVAGVYLVARMFPFYEHSESAALMVTLIGAFTAVGAAAIALVVTDIKRILAYSTLTDLGFMLFALGAGGLTAGMFHLLIHGFSKAILFLGAGSISHGSGQTDIRQMGGLWRKMPITAIIFGIGALSLGGIPPFGGFFSKDEVITAVFDGRGGFFMAIALLIGFMKALYMGRVFFAVFFGKLKLENEHAHESSMVMLAPMLVFAFLALFGGFLAFKFTDAYQGFGYFVFAGEHQEAFHLNKGIAIGSIALAVSGFILAWLAYVQGSLKTEPIIRRFSGVHRVLINKYYVDEVYQWIIDKVVLVTGRFIAFFDRAFINDIGINGTGSIVTTTGKLMRYVQSGKLYTYAMGMIVGFLGLALAWWVS